MFGNVPLIVVESTAALEEIVSSMVDEPVIGVDTESDSFHHYREKVCLIQISDRSRDIIVDPLKCEDISCLGPLLANPDQIKVMHGADYDVVSLKRDYDFETHGLFDTLIAARFLNFERVGLADLIETVFGHHVEKKYQRHDWSMRPLKQEHRDYARGDTHFLLALREYLVRRLDKCERIAAADEECRLLEQREWTGRTRSDADFLRVKGAGALTDAERRVLRAVWLYRDSEAQRLDRPAFKVIPDGVLLDLSTRQPLSTVDLKNIIRGNSSLMRHHGAALVAAVTAGVEDDRPLPSAPPRGRTLAPLPRRAQHVMEALRSWRNRKVTHENLPPMLVASNAILREVARYRPETLEALEEVPGLRVWQREAYGPELVEVCTNATSAESGAGGNKRKRRRKRKKRGATEEGEVPATPDLASGEDGASSTPDPVSGEDG